MTSKFDAGMMAPLTVVLESDTDLRRSEGLTLIDDVSRLLSHQRRLTEVRSATQPLGSPEPLNRARLASRLDEVNRGFRQLSEGARLLNKGLIAGASRLRAAVWLEQKTGLNLTGSVTRAAMLKPPSSREQSAAAPGPVPAAASAPTSALLSGLKNASTALLITQGTPPWDLPGLSKAFDLMAVTNSHSGSVVPPGSADPSVQRPAIRSRLRPPNRLLGLRERKGRPKRCSPN